MMTTSRAVRFLGICILVGCAGKQRLPPGTVVEFEGQRAQYRDVSSPKINLCRADPAPLQREFEEMNTLLGTFLDSTPSKPDPSVTAEQLEALQGSTSLSPAVRAYQLELEKAGQCKFDKKYDFKDLLYRGNELATRSQKRIENAPGFVNYMKAQKALAQWNSARSSEMSQARARNCPGQQTLPRKSRRRSSSRPASSKPVVYYAFEDETGNRQWFFCDGSRVSGSAGQAGEFTPGRQATLPAKAYLDIAARYPNSQVNRAPRLPPLPGD